MKAFETKGGAAILKVKETKHDSRAERAKKIFCTPHFSKCGEYKQANVSFEYTEICCLVVALQWRIQASAPKSPKDGSKPEFLHLTLPFITSLQVIVDISNLICGLNIASHSHTNDKPSLKWAWP